MAKELAGRVDVIVCKAISRGFRASKALKAFIAV
jgi:hypothetical protein